MSGERTRIYLCRHGRTRLNADGLLRGHLDAHLDTVGHAEADDLGRALRSITPLRVLSSPLKRAVQTAQAVATHADVGVNIDLRLVDRDYGPWAGKHPDEVRATFGDFDAAPGVESAASVLARARQVLDDQLVDGEQGAVALMSHVAVNRLLLASLDPSLGEAELIPQRTACWDLLTHTMAGWKVECLDQKGPRP